MKIEKTEFILNGSYETKTFTGMDAVGISRLLTSEPWNPLENHSWDGVTIYIARYVSGKVYRVWAVTGE